MRARVNLMAAAVAIGLSACASVKPDSHAAYDFSKIGRITVMPFVGPGGSAATNEFVRQLLGTGITVSDAHHPGDAILRGTVTDYKSNQPFMIFLGHTTLLTAAGQTVTVNNPVVLQNSGQAVTESGTAGAHPAQVASVVATVALQVVLVDASTKTLLWRGNQTYEALDLDGALHAAVGHLTRSLAAVLPKMRPASS